VGVSDRGHPGRTGNGGRAVPVGRGGAPGDEHGRQRGPGGVGRAWDVGRVDQSARRGDGVVGRAGGRRAPLEVGGQPDGQPEIERQRPYGRAADRQFATVEDEARRAVGVGTELGPVEAHHPVFGRGRVGGGLHVQVDVLAAGGRRDEGRRGVLERQAETRDEPSAVRAEDQEFATGDVGAGPGGRQAQHDLLAGPPGRDAALEVEPGGVPAGPPRIADRERPVGPEQRLGGADRFAMEMVGGDGQRFAGPEDLRLDDPLEELPRPQADVLVRGRHLAGSFAHDQLLVSSARQVQLNSRSAALTPPDCPHEGRPAASAPAWPWGAPEPRGRCPDGRHCSVHTRERPRPVPITQKGRVFLGGFLTGLSGTFSA
jgi:hypothetical protein